MDNLSTQINILCRSPLKLQATFYTELYLYLLANLLTYYRFHK